MICSRAYSPAPVLPRMSRSSRNFRPLRHSRRRATTVGARRLAAGHGFGARPFRQPIANAAVPAMADGRCSTICAGCGAARHAQAALRGELTHHARSIWTHSSSPPSCCSSVGGAGAPSRRPRFAQGPSAHLAVICAGVGAIRPPDHPLRTGWSMARCHTLVYLASRVPS